MPKTKYAKSMQALTDYVHVFLKPLGFRKRGSTWNREPEPGLIHVINFQMGRHDFGVEIPGVRSNLYGLFTINLGVFVREVSEVLRGSSVVGPFVYEYDCELRWRIGDLVPEQSAVWWPLDADPVELRPEVMDALQAFGLQHLDRFVDRDAVLEWLGQPELPRWRRSPIISAVILWQRGERDIAAEVVRKDHEQALADGPDRAAKVRRWATALGIKLPAEGEAEAKAASTFDEILREAQALEEKMRERRRSREERRGVRPDRPDQDSE